MTMKKGKRQWFSHSKDGAGKQSAIGEVEFKVKKVLLWALCMGLMLTGVIAGWARVQATGDLAASPTQVAATGTAQPTPTPSDGWAPYLPSADDVVLIPDPEQKKVYVDITFPSRGYRVASEGFTSQNWGNKPDGSKYYSVYTFRVKLEKSLESTGEGLQPMTIRLAYDFSFEDKNNFCFKVDYNGESVKVKNIIFYKNIQPTPTPSDGWEPYFPTENQVAITAEPGAFLVHVDLTFPDAGYRIVDTGYLRLTYARGGRWVADTLGVQIEKMTGSAAGGTTKYRLTYDLKSLSTQYVTSSIFTFNVFWAGEDIAVTKIYGPTNDPRPTSSPTPTSSGTPYPTPMASDYPTGWGNGTTGGLSGRWVTVKTAAELLNYVQASDKYVIHVNGTIDLGGSDITVASSKSIVGLGPSAVIRNGGLVVKGSTNVIFKNLTFKEAEVGGTKEVKVKPGEVIKISGKANHIWIDRCTFAGPRDQALSIAAEADCMTISRNHFANRSKAIVIGTGEKPTGLGRITLHHNYFDSVNEGISRVRYGQVQLFNNYFKNLGSYGIGLGTEAKILSENNYMVGVPAAVKILDPKQLPGGIKDSGSNVYLKINPELVQWTQVFGYWPNATQDVPVIVEQNAGAWK